MAVKVKDAAAAAQKFVTRAGAAGQDYAAGVANSGSDWMNNTKAASDSWAQGVQAAATSGRFAKGISQNAQTKFTTRVATVGVQRFPQGVAGAKDAWQQGTTPYLNTIAALNLPARGPKGAPQNNARAQAVADALRARKLQGGS